ncbi:CBS domain-containing protein [Oceanomicrobium pacificus]|uniref:CBS domain-containing protein n=1 Tax=Oceanomicrobium pacificus TaxID=2692916 RepID=A0A6B0TMX0_9RHOB|nr:CBS domain-containing protein [Oceanomicrobium pacificus]MXU65877.1 CBS domain-containing protein [Oceanomicrobium pacificus]
MIVSQILSAKPDHDILTISRKAALHDAAKILSEKKIGALIVTEDGKSVDGILSERDIVREIGKRGPDCLDDTVEAVMTPSVIGCQKSDSVLSVLEKMTSGRFRHMPVIDGGKMIGVISIGDAVKARISEIEMENTALADMIAGH